VSRHREAVTGRRSSVSNPESTTGSRTDRPQWLKAQVVRIVTITTLRITPLYTPKLGETRHDNVG
jgi:hypothetical protein